MPYVNDFYFASIWQNPIENLERIRAYRLDSYARDVGRLPCPRMLGDELNADVDRRHDIARAARAMSIKV
jgi:hypothetical protein